jgi:hypothetical protein
MRQKIIEVTKEQFNNIYGNAYLKGKYGDEWVNIVLDNLKREGTTIKFFTEKQVEAKKEIQLINNIKII